MLKRRITRIALMMLVLALVIGCSKDEKDKTKPPATPSTTPVPPTATAAPPTPTAVPPTLTPEPTLTEPTPTPEPTATESPTATPTARATEASDSTGPAEEPFSWFDVSWDDRAIFRPGLVDEAQGLLDGLPGATVYHMEVQISDDYQSLQGREAVHYTNREDEPLQEIYFRLYPNISGGATTVSAVQVSGQVVEPVYESENSAVRLPLPTALQPGESADVTLEFEVQVAQEMAGNYGLFGYFDGVLVLDTFYPVIPVYDQEGWYKRVPPRDGDVTYFDASFYLVRVTAPASLTLVGSGVEVERRQEGENQVVTLAAGPARDFYLAGSEDYVSVSRELDGTTINSYAFPDWQEGAEQALNVTADALQGFGERFGPYPYTEFDVLSTPMLALGIEYPGATGIALGLYDPDAQVAGLPAPIMLESVVVHEVAHQWFYNVVGNDQVDEPWLDEAVVQYATGLYYMDVYGETAARNYRSSWDGRWAAVDRAKVPIGLPVDAYEEGTYGAIVYGRGPLFMMALADEMGQDTFDAFLRDYYQSHRWEIGTGATFRQLAEQHCDCDLTGLFTEWVYGE